MSFPKDPDGDVTIALGPEPKDQLCMNGAVLRAFSGFFKGSLDPRWVDNKIASDQKTGGGVPMKRYTLDYDSDLRFWVIVAGKNESAAESTITSPDPGKGDLGAAKWAYRLLFAWTYHSEAEIPKHISKTTLAKYLGFCLNFYQFSEGFKPKLRTFIDQHCAIEDRPLVFLELGSMVRSKRIFREAFTHSLGLSADKVFDAVGNEYLNDGIEREILETAFKALEQTKIDVRREIMDLDLPRPPLVSRHPAMHTHQPMPFRIDSQDRMVFKNALWELRGKRYTGKIYTGPFSCYASIYETETKDMEQMVKTRLRFIPSSEENRYVSHCCEFLLGSTKKLLKNAFGHHVDSGCCRTTSKNAATLCSFCLRAPSRYPWPNESTREDAAFLNRLFINHWR